MSGVDACPACGRRHRHEVELVVTESGALEQLLAFVAQRAWRRLVVVADANTEEAVGASVVSDLIGAGHEVRSVIFPERHGLLADEAATERVRRAIVDHDAEVAIAVGSGTLNDITRYSSFHEHRPYCSVPTAASMDGYASSMAAMQFDGVKVTWTTQAPLAIFAEPAVIASAPTEMTIWGLGDLMGKASACFDWRLGHALTGETYCPAIEARVVGLVRRCSERVEGLLHNDKDALSVLVAGLIESGLAMAMQGNSRPASGCEHQISHFLDLLAFRGLRPHHPHGLQVAYATGFTTRLQQRVLEHLEAPMAFVPGADNPDQERWLGKPSVALEQVRDEKAEAYRAYSSSWPLATDARERLRDALVEASEQFGPIQAALEAAKVPFGPGFIDVDTDMLRATLRYANRLRSRVTTLDLYEAQGCLNDEIDRLVAAGRTS
ncbi:MAG: sn-glycerol-1-phosphate dehydrogenase [Actinomycetota bacterium]|nr:sn-glycerol-1-phosphate dehydrogenase [Actinomycetota bacterium]